MSEPYFIPDSEMLSECCDAVAVGEIVDGLGICSKCKEWSDFYDINGEKMDS